MEHRPPMIDLTQMASWKLKKILRRGKLQVKGSKNNPELHQVGKKWKKSHPPNIETTLTDGRSSVKLKSRLPLRENNRSAIVLSDGLTFLDQRKIPDLLQALSMSQDPESVQPRPVGK